MKPIIGLTGAITDDFFTSIFAPYTKAIEMAGGVPLLLPYTQNADTLDDFAALCDGFLLTGGADIDPTRYGERPLSACGALQQNRDALELALLDRVLKTDKPVLGICRGAQVLNVALGGTLYQDIPTQCPSQLAHNQSEGMFDHSHEVDVLPSTPLFDLLAHSRVVTNSFHHQAVKQPGRGLAVMARADDGVIEALYHTAHPYMRLYQWHPERLCPKDAVHRALFDDFVAACRAAR